VQTHSFDLDKIRPYLTGANEVYLTREPAVVVSRVVTEKVDIVVTGQYFYDVDIATGQQPETLLTPGNARFHIAPQFGLYTGTILAQQIKSVSPEVLVFRCSKNPGEIGDLVGEITKDENFEDLLYFVNFPFLGDIIKKKDWKKLKEAFPIIRIYKNQEKRSCSILEDLVKIVVRSPLSFFGF
jgi:hypothetical protein